MRFFVIFTLLLTLVSCSNYNKLRFSKKAQLPTKDYSSVSVLPKEAIDVLKLDASIESVYPSSQQNKIIFDRSIHCPTIDVQPASILEKHNVSQPNSQVLNIEDPVVEPDSGKGMRISGGILTAIGVIVVSAIFITASFSFATYIIIPLSIVLIIVGLSLLISGIKRKKKKKIAKKEQINDQTTPGEKALTMGKLSYIPLAGLIFAVISFIKVHAIRNAEKSTQNELSLANKAWKLSVISLLIGAAIILAFLVMLLITIL